MSILIKKKFTIYLSFLLVLILVIPSSISKNISINDTKSYIEMEIAKEDNGNPLFSKFFDHYPLMMRRFVMV